jgi:peptidoglycan/xylan/chitin deacetylase (PgdA/CDA1 family)
VNPWSLLERAFGWGGVVAYHGVGDLPPAPVMHISPDRLRSQLEVLGEQHQIVRLRELVDRWRSGVSTRNRVAITFDDAYSGVLVHALPILRELDIPATVFVASDHAALGASYWWDDVEAIIRKRRGPELVTALDALQLRDSGDGVPVTMDCIRQTVLSRFAGRWPGGLRPGGDTIWRSMRLSELKELAADALIDFGVHTLSHPALPLLSYQEQVREMRVNLTSLQSALPRVLPVVAYPYGLYDRSTVRAAREAGMIAGVTMEGRATANNPDPMIAPRVGAGELHPPLSLTRKLNRALRPVLVIRNRGRHPRIPAASARVPRDRAVES